MSVDLRRRSRCTITINKHSRLLLTEYAVNGFSVFYAGFVFIVLRFVWTGRIESFHRAKTFYLHIYHLINIDAWAK